MELPGDSTTVRENPQNLEAAIARYLAAEKALNAVNDAGGSPEEVEFYASIANIMEGKLEASSFQGAMNALQLAQKEVKDFDGSSMAEPLLDGAMAYFDRLQATTGVAPQNAARMLQSFDLSRMNGYGWHAIYDALTIIAHALEGITQQPRCGDGADRLSPAGEYVEAISDFALTERSRLVEWLTTARPKTKDGWDARDAILLMDRVSWLEGGVTGVAEYALSLHAERVEHLGEKRNG